MATFITSKGIGQNIEIQVQTSTGYWKYNHNSTDSSVFTNGNQGLPVQNINGEFTLIPCLSDGTPSGDINLLFLNGNQLTSFDGTGLSALTQLFLNGNQLTSFDGTGLSALTTLALAGNNLNTFDGTGLTALTNLSLQYNTIINTPGNNDAVLSFLASIGTSNGFFATSGDRTTASDDDWVTLTSRGWSIIGAGSAPSSENGSYYYYGGGGSGIGGDNLIVRKLRVKGVGQLNQ
jgi:hypothetical protein